MRIIDLAEYDQDKWCEFSCLLIKVSDDHHRKHMKTKKIVTLTIMLKTFYILQNSPKLMGLKIIFKNQHLKIWKFTNIGKITITDVEQYLGLLGGWWVWAKNDHNMLCSL